MQETVEGCRKVICQPTFRNKRNQAIVDRRTGIRHNFEQKGAELWIRKK